MQSNTDGFNLDNCKVMDLAKFGQLIGKSTDAVRKLVERDRIRAKKGTNGRWFVEVSEIERFLNRNAG